MGGRLDELRLARCSRIIVFSSSCMHLPSYEVGGGGILREVDGGDLGRLDGEGMEEGGGGSWTARGWRRGMEEGGILDAWTMGTEEGGGILLEVDGGKMIASTRYYLRRGTMD